MAANPAQALADALQAADRATPVQGLALAVSGGSDSMALLAAAAELVDREPRFREAWVLHVDHGLRPEAAIEGAMVKTEARRLGFSVRLLTLDGARPGSGSLESWARNVRYESLEAAMRALDLDLLVTAHHLHDQAETVALALMRGSGGLGLQGMRSLRALDGPGMRLARPFLEIGRPDLDQYRRDAGLNAADDESNRYLGHRRNLLRHLALSEDGCLESERLLALAARARSLEDRLRDWAERRVAGAAPAFENKLVARVASIDDAAVADLPEAAQRSIVRVLLRQLGRQDLMPSRAALATLESSGSTVEFSRDCHASRMGGRLVVVRDCAPPTFDRQVLKVQGEPVPLPGGGRLQVGTAAGEPGKRGRQQAIPRDEITGPLVLRLPEAGERLQPFGMRGTKSVVEVFREAGIDARERKLRPVVADDLGILWVPGLRASERCRVGPGSVDTLILEWLD